MHAILRKEGKNASRCPYLHQQVQTPLVSLQHTPSMQMATSASKFSVRLLPKVFLTNTAKYGWELSCNDFK